MARVAESPIPAVEAGARVSIAPAARNRAAAPFLRPRRLRRASRRRTPTRTGPHGTPVAARPTRGLAVPPGANVAHAAPPPTARTCRGVSGDLGLPSRADTPPAITPGGRRRAPARRAANHGAVAYGAACDPSPLATRRRTSSSARRSCSSSSSTRSPAASRSPASPTTCSRGATTVATPPPCSPGSVPRPRRRRRSSLGHERADADDALPPGDRRAGVRDARVPGAGPDLPRRRHRRGDERDADHRRRVPRPQGAADEDGRGDHGHPAALGRGAGGLRGRVLQAAARHDLRPAGRAGADLRGGERTAGGEAGRPRRRRLHLHQRQGPAALRRPAGQRQGGRGEGRPRLRARSSA